jgi:hypothetical protein
MLAVLSPSYLVKERRKPMSRLTSRFAPIVLAVALSLVIAAPTQAGIGLSYFEVTQGTSPTQVVVTWGTETETDTAGFVIKRATDPDPAQALIIHIEPARGSATTGYDYQYTDTGLTPGQVYYYWLIELTTYGQLVTLGVRQITAGGTLPIEMRVFLPLAPISAAGSVGGGR